MNIDEIKALSEEDRVKLAKALLADVRWADVIIAEYQINPETATWVNSHGRVYHG